MSGVKVSVGSMCRFRAWGQSVGGVKVSEGSKCPWGQSVEGVKVSLGSKCQQGQIVFGVNLGVSPFGAWGWPAGVFWAT